jgi:CubicO group peptidase (beta-lactamase class C family)
VSGDQTVFARGYGHRELERHNPVTPETVYPIASTSKAFNATLLGLLIDDGQLEWDAPVQRYLPGFRLRDPLISGLVTTRDLVAMRTGLPRHDFTWTRTTITRAELVSGLRHLELSAGFREKFQYNNLTATAAGHVAEAITGKTWESLIQERILGPLQMTNTSFSNPAGGNVTLSYHENSRRELVLNRRFPTEVIAPAGGSIHSNVLDMARWMSFNLSSGEVQGRPLIQPQTLAELQSPQIPARSDPSCPSPNACYALGWFVDTYRGSARVCHGGYIHDVGTEVSLYPEEGIGIVTFVNFGSVGLTRILTQHAFDLIKGFELAKTAEDKRIDYEKKVEETRQRNASAQRVENTSPSHPLSNYEGEYREPAYGRIAIHRTEQGLAFQRGDLILPLEHWHYDSWVARESDLFLIIIPHAFDRTSRFLFETNADGKIAAVSIRLEPTVAPIRFVKQ